MDEIEQQNFEKWFSSVQWNPLYLELIRGAALEAWSARAARPSAVPEGYTWVKTETLSWLLGESGDFECPPEQHFRGKPAPYFWRNNLRAAMLAAAPQPPAETQARSVEWRREWQGSGPQRGFHIREAVRLCNNRVIAYLGDQVDSGEVDKLIAEHNGRHPNGDSLRPAKPAECIDGCPDRQVCNHCQWPEAPTADDEPVCSDCKGSGEVLGLVDAHRGPDAYHTEVPCPRCNGTGMLSAPPQPAIDVMAAAREGEKRALWNIASLAPGLVRVYLCHGGNAYALVPGPRHEELLIALAQIRAAISLEKQG